jgi:hypothetical protein
MFGIEDGLGECWVLAAGRGMAGASAPKAPVGDGEGTGREVDVATVATGLGMLAMGRARRLWSGVGRSLLILGL